ncbi:MAG: diacylglycerol kinase family lipid kinase [Capsulimonadaceae bacterium]|nr:diacylglycerol kinase family lipid kinase [Capsulimonadaceae bacterium]
MKSLLIVNTTAGQRAGDDVLRQLSEAYGDQTPPMSFTTGAGDAHRLAYEAAITGRYDCVCAVGGDGTVNEVASGLIEAAPQSSRPLLGILPCGTSNILATELGIPGPDLRGAVDVIREGFVKKIDYGRVGDKIFLLMAGCGLDAEAVRDVFAPLKSVMGPGAYVMSGLAALATFETSRVVLTYDDETLTADSFVIVVANVSAYGVGAVKLAPFAALDDGWLDICLFEKPPMDKIGILGQVMRIVARRHIGDPRVRYLRAKRIVIDADPPLAAQIDGDTAGQTPMTIELVEKSLSVLAPAEPLT